MKAIFNVIGAVALMSSASTVFAEVAPISGNVALLSDYVFRGQSQTDESAAIQGGFDWSHESGFYVGAWGSNVDFGTSAQAEVDYYLGYSGSVSESVGYDVSYIYYSYVGESPFNYQEFALSFSLHDVTVGVNYSNEYLGDGGEDFYYFHTGYSFALPQEFSLDLHYGFNSADNMDITFDGTGDDSYSDWSVGIGKEVAGLGFSLTYYGTDISSGNPLADDRVVFGVSKSL